MNSARSLPALPSHSYSLAHTFSSKGLCSGARDPDPTQLRTSLGVGSLHRYSLVLPRAQLSFPKCRGLFSSLPMCLLDLGYQDESPANEDLPVLSPSWGQPCVSFTSPFTSLLSSLLWVWTSSGGHSVSGCLSIRMSVVECSPVLLLPLRFPWIWAFQGPGPLPLGSTGLPIPEPKQQLPGPHKANTPSATEEIKRGRGQSGLGKACKDKADSLAGPQAAGSRKQGAPRMVSARTRLGPRAESKAWA